ncbi:MAG TPA: DUF502 domain-containing protein [Candidatus Babeliales bacterium]|jgi:uncharacterized membrane protein|nr:DUF502 domain-containing protein [Candidatus Babeliales bacterium]
MEKTRIGFKKIISTIGSLFITGLFIILPLTITLIVLNSVIRFISRWLEPIHRILQPTFLGVIPYAEIFLIFFTILLIGFIYRIFIIRSLIHAIDALFGSIPLISPIYSGIRQLLHAFNAQDGFTFKQVVLIEFPRKGVYSIGFVTSKLPVHLKPEDNTDLYGVYIPTTPNPATGFFVVASPSEYMVVDLTRQEAMALIMSGGIVQPDRFMSKDS